VNPYRLKGASGPVVNRSFDLGERTVIGRGADCDLRLDYEGVAERHAEISAGDGGGLTLCRLDAEAQLLLNGEPVTQAALGSGDEIRIASCRFVLQAPGLRPDRVLSVEAVSPRRPYLPWLIVAGLLAAAAAAWYLGLLDFS
jgi:pSer/pThr/pTyr-binding forkhead associated (FHA) protein